jgi:hypothetical protein
MCITKILKYVFELKRDEVKSNKNIVVLAMVFLILLIIC